MGGGGGGKLEFFFFFFLRESFPAPNPTRLNPHCIPTLKYLLLVLGSLHCFCYMYREITAMWGCPVQEVLPEPRDLPEFPERRERQEHEENL